MSKMAEFARENQDVTGPSSPTGPKVYSAICAVIAALGKEGISKDRKNSQQGYQFRGIDDVYNVLSRQLAAAKLCILPRVLHRTVTEQQTKAGGILFYVVLDVEFDLVSAEDGSKHTIGVCGEAMDSGDKATNKAMSAAYKYACMQTFCIPTEGDNDADSTTHDVVRQPEPPEFSVEFLAKYVAKFRDAIAKRADNMTLICHDDLQNEGQEQYSAVWRQLGAGERAAIKESIARAREAKAGAKF